MNNKQIFAQQLLESRFGSHNRKEREKEFNDFLRVERKKKRAIKRTCVGRERI